MLIIIYSVELSELIVTKPYETLLDQYAGSGNFVNKASNHKEK